MELWARMHNTRSASCVRAHDNKQNRPTIEQLNENLNASNKIHDFVLRIEIHAWRALALRFMQADFGCACATPSSFFSWMSKSRNNVRLRNEQTRIKKPTKLIRLCVNKCNVMCTFMCTASFAQTLNKTSQSN